MLWLWGRLRKRRKRNTSRCRTPMVRVLNFAIGRCWDKIKSFGEDVQGLGEKEVEQMALQIVP